MGGSISKACRVRVRSGSGGGEVRVGVSSVRVVVSERGRSRGVGGLMMEVGRRNSARSRNCTRGTSEDGSRSSGSHRILELVEEMRVDSFVVLGESRLSTEPGGRGG